MTGAPQPSPARASRSLLLQRWWAERLVEINTGLTGKSRAACLRAVGLVLQTAKDRRAAKGGLPMSDWKRLIHDLLHVILGELRMVQADIERIRQAVANQTTVEAGLIEAFNGLAQLVRDNVGNPVELNAIADQIESNTAAMVAAVQSAPPPAPPTP